MRAAERTGRRAEARRAGPARNATSGARGAGAWRAGVPLLTNGMRTHGAYRRRGDGARARWRPGRTRTQRHERGARGQHGHEASGDGGRTSTQRHGRGARGTRSLARRGRYSTAALGSGGGARWPGRAQPGAGTRAAPDSAGLATRGARRARAPARAHAEGGALRRRRRTRAGDARHEGQRRSRVRVEARRAATQRAAPRRLLERG
jgi:hypothetical protein